MIWRKVSLHFSGPAKSRRLEGAGDGGRRRTCEDIEEAAARQIFLGS